MLEWRELQQATKHLSSSLEVKVLMEIWEEPDDRMSRPGNGGSTCKATCQYVKAAAMPVVMHNQYTSAVGTSLLEYRLLLIMAGYSLPLIIFD